MKDSTGITKYEYNPANGNLNKVTYPDGKDISYVYDDIGNKKEIVTRFGQSIKYNYNALNLIQSIQVNNKDMPTIQYEYFDNGNLKQKIQKNGVSTLYTYNSSDLTEVSQLTATGQTIKNYKYQFDPNQNIVKVIENYKPKEFTYDSLDRIVTSSEKNENYSYDAKGNRKTLTSDQLPTLKSTLYSFDANNHLTKVKVGDNEVSYRYNGDGLLYERKVGNKITRYYHDGDMLLADYTSIQLLRFLEMNAQITIYNSKGSIMVRY